MAAQTGQVFVVEPGKAGNFEFSASRRCGSLGAPLPLEKRGMVGGRVNVVLRVRPGTGDTDGDAWAGAAGAGAKLSVSQKDNTARLHRFRYEGEDLLYQSVDEKGKGKRKKEKEDENE
jgi:hypothetical protein